MQFVVSLLILIASFVFLIVRPGMFSGLFTILGIVNFAVIFIGGKNEKRAPEELENLVENLNDRSLKDNLTGAYNRLAFDRHLNEVYRRFKIFNEQFFVIFFDIDYFKKFNDDYGHEAGDRVLRAFSQTIIGHTRRDKDRFFRYGGEEFVMIVTKPNIPPREDAMYVIENLKKITCSMGAGFPDKNKEKEAAVKEADENVYRAKENGRNRAYLDKDTVII